MNASSARAAANPAGDAGKPQEKRALLPNGYVTMETTIPTLSAAFVPGAVWRDTDGAPIQAHGGGILRANDTFYWYGENKNAPNNRRADGTPAERVDVIGVSCYSSRDLRRWKNEGVVLAARPDDPAHDLHPSQVFERPKVIHCPATGKFVLWAHVDSPDYKKASVGVAVADEPTGPFAYRGSFQPNRGESRDMTVFVDPASPDMAYLLYSSEGNETLHITPLTPDFLSVDERAPVSRAFVGESREAPAAWFHEGRYYLITSGCTGWRPNPARWHVADSLLGEWVTMGDPCVGDADGTTFNAQSTFVLPVGDEFVFLADRWNRHNLQDSRYVWLPLRMANGVPHIEWHDTWQLRL